MKKLISTNTLSSIALALALCLGACGKNNPGQPAGTPPDSSQGIDTPPSEVKPQYQGLAFDIQKRGLRSCVNDSVDTSVLQQVLPLIFHASPHILKKDDKVQVDSLIMHWHADEDTGKWRRFEAKTKVKVNSGNWAWLDLHNKPQADSLASILTQIELGCPLGASCNACYAQRNNCKVPCLAYVAIDGIIIAVVSDIFDE